MSQLLIQHYLNQLADLRKVSGTNREMVVREAFKDLPVGAEPPRRPPRACSSSGSAPPRACAGRR